MHPLSPSHCTTSLACTMPLPTTRVSQSKITCKVGRRPIGPTNVTVEVATQVSNGHPVRLECPKGHIADPQSLLCYLPDAEGEVVVSTTSVVVAIGLGAALLLLLLFSRRLYRQKGAAATPTRTDANPHRHHLNLASRDAMIPQRRRSPSRARGGSSTRGR